MSRRRHSMGRRAFLGGAAALVALPFLPSLPRGYRKAFAGAGSGGVGPNGQPQRLLFYFVPNGIHMPSWTPAAEGADWVAPPILQPVEGLRAKLNILTGLDNIPGEPDGAGDHAAGTGAFLTCRHVHKTEGDDIDNGVSVDQVAANAYGQATRLGSIQLGLEGGSSVGGCDSGYSCAYTRNISWSGPKTPLPKLVNPQLVFDRFFVGFDAEASAAELARRHLFRVSVLDHVSQEAKALSTGLGSGDRYKLDEYLTGIRELELQIEAAQSAPACDPIAYPAPNLSVTEHADIMSDLMVVAFQCDISRIQTFMFGNGISGRSYGFLGVQGGHHDISHHQNNEENFAALEIIGTYEMERFAYLLNRLDSVVEGEDGSTLLDNSLVYFSSEIEDGNTHRHTNMPILTAGAGGGAFATGEHRIYEGHTVADFYMTLLAGVGVDVDSFGDDGTQLVPGLLTSA